MNEDEQTGKRENQGLEAGKEVLILEKTGEIRRAIAPCLARRWRAAGGAAPLLLVVAPGERGEKNRLPAHCRTALLPGNLAGGLGGLWVDSAVSYGTGSRDTLTLSSREEGRLWAALQREVVTVDGALVERQEFSLRLRPGVEENTLLAQAGALVLLGVPPQKVDQVLGKNQKFLAKQQMKW